MNKEYAPGKITKLWDYLAKMHKEKPEIFDDAGFLRANVAQVWLQLNDRTHCPNCQASMVQYLYELDIINAVMLLEMGKEVQERIRRCTDENPLRWANRIRIQDMKNATYAMKSRTTQMSKLGLIAKYTENGRHVPGMWVITRRGFDALAGKPVPRMVVVWRTEIIERPEDTITLAQAFSVHSDKVRRAIERKKKVRSDYSSHIQSYIPSEWVEVAGITEGTLL